MEGRSTQNVCEAVQMINVKSAEVNGDAKVQTDVNTHSSDVSLSNGISTIEAITNDCENITKESELVSECNMEIMKSNIKSEHTESDYYILDEESVVHYIRTTVSLWERFADGSQLDVNEIVHAREVGDGNLNLVFLLYNSQGKSRAVVKQALPYVRCVGTSWPMSITRNHMEAITLHVHYKYCPSYTEKLLFHDAEMGVMVLEDLSRYVIWRRELCQCRFYAQVASQLATYLAQVHFHTSDFYLTSAEKKLAVQRLLNLELCENTETLFFTEPYIVSKRNNYEDELENIIQHYLREDAELHRCVAQLKCSFMTHAEAHLHGDIHSGSVFVNAESNIKVIDAEFGFYGPLGFDLGNVIGSLLLNYLALPYLLNEQNEKLEQEENYERHINEANDSNECCKDDEKLNKKSENVVTKSNPHLLLNSIVDFWNTYQDVFANLSATSTNDVTFAFDGYCKFYLHHVWCEAIGFTGTELIRRTVGLSHVIDVDGIINCSKRVEVKEMCIKLGCYLIKHASTFDNVDRLVQTIANFNYLS